MNGALEPSPSTIALSGPISTAAFLCLLAGGCAIGFAPIFVRLADTGPVASAFWRAALAAPLLFVWAWRVRGSEPERRTPSGAILGAGLFFAADLGVWHWSIVYTSVANSTLLANLAPVFVTLGGLALVAQGGHTHVSCGDGDRRRRHVRARGP